MSAGERGHTRAGAGSWGRGEPAAENPAVGRHRVYTSPGSRALYFSQLASHAGALFIPEIGERTPGTDSERENEERPSPVLQPLTREESWLAGLLHPAFRPLPVLELRAPKYVYVCGMGDERLENLFLCPVLGLLACFTKQQPGQKNIMLTWRAFSDLQASTVDRRCY